MSTTKITRRTALKSFLMGSVVVTASGCQALQSLPRGRNVGGTTDGSDLANRVRDALSRHALTSQLRVDITSVEDEVIIKGFVPSKGDVINVEQVANQVDGVRHALIDLYVR